MNNFQIPFIIWKVYQRRAESLAVRLNLYVYFIHYSWEEKSKIHKAFSYILKTIATIIILLKHKPTIFIIQLPPTPLLYLTYFYCLIFDARYITDCHNAMIYGSWWVKWPFAKYLLSKSQENIVHNKFVAQFAHNQNIDTIVLRDPLLSFNQFQFDLNILEQLRLKKKDYIIIPCSFDPDEPLEELFKAISQSTDNLFVVTWYLEKLPDKYKKEIPKNVIFSGFLNVAKFNALYFNAGAALVLSNREGTQPSGATEAISFEVPLILSDMKATRNLFADAAIYVDNSCYSIVKGIEEAKRNEQHYIKNMKRYKRNDNYIIEKQLNEIAEIINSD